jgi:putative tryptophan/tyrosine transport system substrate-binding protein
MKKAAALSILVVVALLAVGVIAEAQQAKKVPRIGFLAPSDPPSQSTEAIRLALRDLAYIEGQNIAIEYRYAEGSQRNNF